MGESARTIEGKLMIEQAPPGDRTARGGKGAGRPVRSLSINLAESPLGWFHARGHVTTRQCQAGERGARGGARSFDVTD